MWEGTLLDQSAPVLWEGVRSATFLWGATWEETLQGNLHVRSISSSLVRGNSPRWQEHLKASKLQSLEGECEKEHSKFNQLQSRERECESVHSKADKNADKLQSRQGEMWQGTLQSQSAPVSWEGMLQWERVPRSISSSLMRGNENEHPKADRKTGRPINSSLVSERNTPMSSLMRWNARGNTPRPTGPK